MTLTSLQLILCSFGGFGDTASLAPYPWIPCLYMRGRVCAQSLTRVRLFSAPWLLCSWDSPGKSTGVGCHALIQGIFPTLGSNLSLLGLLQAGGSLPGRQVLYH